MANDTPTVENTTTPPPVTTKPATTASVTSVAPTAAPTSPPTVTSTPPRSPLDFASYVAGLKASGTNHEHDLIDALEKYVAAMRPGQIIHGDTGAEQQYRLWRVIWNTAHAAPQAEFRNLWSILLQFFLQYKDSVFHDRYAFRFSEYWIKSLDELDAFQRVLNLLKLTADPSLRGENLKKVNIIKTLQVGFEETARQRIINYYNPS